MLEESISTSPTFWAGIFSWFTPTVFFVLLQLVIGTIYITSTLANNHKHHHQEHQQQHPQAHHDFQQQQLARSPSVLQRLKSINFYSPYSYRSQDPYNHNTQEFQVHEQQQQQQQQLPRSPSLLQRFKSINLYSYFPTEPLSAKVTTTHDNNVSNITTYEPEKQLQQQHVYDTVVVETDEEENEEEEDDVVGKIFQHNYQKGHVEGTGGGGDGSSMDEIYSKLQGQYGNFKRTQSDTKPASGEVPVKLPKKMKKSASSKSAFSHFKEDDIVESRRPATVREKKVTVATEDDDEVDAKADDFINKFKQQLKLQRLDSIMKKEVIGK
ncbi:hypothetical protein TanjilG_11781 [Lupinus angustifolius]|uniref:DUF4408 domain-containing protein n=1 Tax=Lupinus angustifolius TaxID=3871 RepID=A0A4P1R667_LUPAN|nr:PREDICTED: myb-like protein AA [Lupinus angustifolius]XP_019458214.1 PREDICTED: myb-like protein AA [Lupinus angustifolius]XP_019458215.1 PREDICTED: myb-like protein AA [Lupinus angustifolius]OIW03144.1 hypothetical protein TanjilG_11781 [Lupinus angustifolius]